MITPYRPAKIVVATGRTNCRLSPCDQRQLEMPPCGRWAACPGWYVGQYVRGPSMNCGAAAVGCSMTPTPNCWTITACASSRSIRRQSRKRRRRAAPLSAQGRHRPGHMAHSTPFTKIIPYAKDLLTLMSHTVAIYRRSDRWPEIQGLIRSTEGGKRFLRIGLRSLE